MAALKRYPLPSRQRLVEHILHHPSLVAGVRELPPPVLGRLVDEVGLESAGELIALASTEQLQHIFDADLWESEQAGRDPHFDAARFATWLEVMSEAGEAAVVERLRQLPVELVSLAVHRLILVIDMDALWAEMAASEEDMALVDKALDGCLGDEWEEFRLVARDPLAWDTVFGALMALDRDHHDLLRRILERCRQLSTELIEDNGSLYDVLTADEMLETEMRAERDERRAAQGHVAPSDARSFLELARTTEATLRTRDPVTRAYFRELEAHRGEARTSSSAIETREGGAPGAEALLGLLAGAGVIQSAHDSIAALGPRSSDEALSVRDGSLEQALRELSEARPEAHAERMEELGFLANVLMEGWAPEAQRLRPAEAIEAAVEVIELGLSQVRSAPGPTRGERAVDVLSTTHLDQLFHVGWHALHKNASTRSSTAFKFSPKSR